MLSRLTCPLLLCRYVHEDPYRNDHRFHGWIGLCCFHLAKEESSRQIRARESHGGSDPHVNDKRSGARMPSFRRRDYAADAREHLLRALELNPREDQYVRCLSQVLLWADKKSAARNLLLNFCVLNPNNPEGFRYYENPSSSSQLKLVANCLAASPGPHALHVGWCDKVCLLPLLFLLDCFVKCCVLSKAHNLRQALSC